MNPFLDLACMDLDFDTITISMTIKSKTQENMDIEDWERISEVMV